MIVDLEKLIPRERKDPPPERLDRLESHYAERLKKYGYEPRDKEAFQKLARYFGRYYAGLPLENGAKNDITPPAKGLILFGPCGTGKTFAMRIFSGLFKVEIVSALELSQHFEIGGAAMFFENAQNFNGKALVIDEIGGERDTLSFGNKSPVIDFISKREDEYRLDRVLTFFTTNLKNREELAARYGDRITSRILGMCEPVMLKGRDWRHER
mgnify:CR=1 FL=1